jgi:hypothetical protein
MALSTPATELRSSTPHVFPLSAQDSVELVNSL